MAKNYNVTYEKDALGSFLDELPGLLNQYKLSQAQSALQHERAMQVKTMDLVAPDNLIFNDDGDIDRKASMGKQNFANTWTTAGMTAALPERASFGFDSADESTGKYTFSDYTTDKNAISELIKGDSIGHSDALAIINMGLFDLDGDELLPGGESIEDVAVSMSDSAWWNTNKDKIGERADHYFKGVLANPGFTDAEKYDMYKNSEIARKEVELNKLINDNDRYKSAKESVNTLMDAGGAWKVSSGLMTEDGDYVVNGKEISPEKMFKDYKATYQLSLASKPLDWLYEQYKDGGDQNETLQLLNKENPMFYQNYIKPLLGDMETIGKTNDAYELMVAGLNDFTQSPQVLPPELETALSKFQTDDLPEPGGPNYISGSDWAAFYSNTEGDSLNSYITNISRTYGEDISSLQFVDLDTDKLIDAISVAEGFGVQGAIPTTHNNPGNLKYIGQPGATKGQPDTITNDGTHYAMFTSKEDGIAALRADIEAKKNRISSGGGLSPGASGGAVSSQQGSPSKSNRMSQLVNKGVSPDYINILGNQIDEYSDDTIISLDREYKFQEFYNPATNINAYSDIYEIQNEDEKLFMINHLNSEQREKYEQFETLAISSGYTSVGNISTLPFVQEYQDQLKEVELSQKALENRDAKAALIQSELDNLNNQWDKMLASEKELSGGSLGSVLSFKAAPDVRLKQGLSETFGNEGVDLWNEIQEKENALNALTGYSRLENVGRKPLLGPGNLVDPLMYDYMQDRERLQTAKDRLQSLIEEELDALPDLYRTSGGR